jgi:hypothetical protein
MLEDRPQLNEAEPLLPAYAQPEVQSTEKQEIHVPITETSEAPVATESVPDETLPPAPTDEWIPGPGATRNVDKAHEMALAGEQSLKDQQEIEDWHSQHPDDAFQVTPAEYIDDYGLSMIKNKREFGEPLTLGDETFETICNFVIAHPEIKSDEISLDDPEWDGLHLIFTGTFGENRKAGLGANFGPNHDLAYAYLPELKIAVRSKGYSKSKGRQLTWTASPLNSRDYYSDVSSHYEDSNGTVTHGDEYLNRAIAEEDLDRLQKILGSVNNNPDQSKTA